MLLHITFVYEAEIVAVRKRNAERRHYLATTTVEVREMDGAELPVAFRCKGSAYGRDRDHTYEIRWTPDMGHWQERLDFDRGREGAVRLDAKWLEGRCDVTHRRNQGYGGGPFGLFPDNCSYDVRSLTRIEADPTLAKVVSSTHDGRVEEILKRAADMLLVDGFLMETTDEPAYVASGPTSIWEEDKRVSVSVKRAGGEVDGYHLYRADEFGHILESLELRHAASPTIEVLDPDAIRAPLPERAVLNVARLVREGMQDYLKDNDRAYFDAFALVRDASEALASALDEHKDKRHLEEAPDASELVDALQAVLPHLAKGNPFSVDWMAKRVSNACERYDARRLATSFAFPTA